MAEVRTYTADELEARFWERRHTTEGDRTIPLDPITNARDLDHTTQYTKPRPGRWWEWHCEVCNAPIASRPR